MAGGLNNADLTVTTTCQQPDPAPATTWKSCGGPACQPGDAVVVEVDYIYHMIWPLALREPDPDGVDRPDAHRMRSRAGFLRAALAARSSDAADPREGERGQILVLFTLLDRRAARASPRWSSTSACSATRTRTSGTRSTAGRSPARSNLPENATAANGTAMQYADTQLSGAAARGSGRHQLLLPHRRPQRRREARPVRHPDDVQPGRRRRRRPGAAATASAPHRAMPAEGDTCNTLVLTGTTSVQFGSAAPSACRAGTPSRCTSAACKGPCGSQPVALVDVALVVDRTSSMSGVDTTNARSAADSVRKLYNPAAQWLSFGDARARARAAGRAPRRRRPRIGTAMQPTDLRRWMPVGLSGAGASFASDYSAVDLAAWPRPSRASRTRAPGPTSPTRSRWRRTS